MAQVGFMWECACGHTEYNEEEPEECSQCGAVSNFIKMPEEIVEERERELLEEKPELKTASTKAKATRGRKKK
jgi:hypothetical protein